MPQPAIQEPMTLATDYALALLGLIWGADLLRRPSRAAKLWGCGFLAMAAGALFGGTAHGFIDWLDPAQRALIWTATTYSIGLASFFLLAATGAGALPRGAARTLTLIAAAKLAVYLWWMSSHDEFRFVIYDYGPSMLVVLVVHLWAWQARQTQWAGWIAVGVATSFVAAGVQLSGLKLHQYLNHNDIYHLVQMAGLWLFWRGAKQAG